MRPYVEKTHDWDETLFDKYFEPEKVSIIQVNGIDSGVLKVEYFEDYPRIDNLLQKSWICAIFHFFSANSIGDKMFSWFARRAKRLCYNRVFYIGIWDE